MTYEHKTLACIACRAEFIWSAGEQAWYAERGLQQPRRCRACRAARADSATRSRPEFPIYRGSR